MNNFFALYTYELKKILKRKIVWITMGILIAIAVFMGIVEPLTSTYSVTTGGTTVQMSGFEYLSDKKETDQMLDGQKIDDALLEKVAEAYQRRHVLEEGSGITITEEFVEGQSQKQKQYEEIYNYVYYVTGDYEAIHSIDADTLYQTRIDKLQNEWNTQLLTEGEKEYWLEKESGIEQPYTYGYAGGWERVLTEVLTVNFMIFLAIAICLANVFSEEHLRKTDQVILCSKYGKRSLFYSKVAAGVTFGLVSGVVLILAASITTLCVYGMEGYDRAVQIYLPMCSWNLTIGQAALLMGLVCVIASIFYSIIAMFLSEAIKNGVAVMGIMTGSLIFTMLVEVPYRYRVLSQIYGLLPTVLTRVWQLWDDRLVKVGSVYLTNFQIAPIIYIVLGGLLIVWGNRIYKNYQVSGR